MQNHKGKLEDGLDVLDRIVSHNAGMEFRRNSAVSGIIWDEDVTEGKDIEVQVIEFDSFEDIENIPFQRRRQRVSDEIGAAIDLLSEVFEGHADVEYHDLGNGVVCVWDKDATDGKDLVLRVMGVYGGEDEEEDLPDLPDRIYDVRLRFPKLDLDESTDIAKLIVDRLRESHTR